MAYVSNPSSSARILLWWLAFARWPVERDRLPSAAMEPVAWDRGGLRRR